MSLRSRAIAARHLAIFIFANSQWFYGGIELPDCRVRGGVRKFIDLDCLPYVSEIRRAPEKLLENGRDGGEPVRGGKGFVTEGTEQGRKKGTSLNERFISPLRRPGKRRMELEGNETAEMQMNGSSQRLRARTSTSVGLCGEFRAADVRLAARLMCY